MSNETIEINNGARGIDAARLQISGYTAIGLMGSLFVAAFFMTSLIRDTDNRINTLSRSTDNQITQVTKQIADLVLAVEKLGLNTEDRFKKRDAAYYCVLTALANPGHVCVNPLAGQRKFLYSGMGWKGSIDRVQNDR